MTRPRIELPDILTAPVSFLTYLRRRSLISTAVRLSGGAVTFGEELDNRDRIGRCHQLEQYS